MRTGETAFVRSLPVGSGRLGVMGAVGCLFLLQWAMAADPAFDAWREADREALRRLREAERQVTGQTIEPPARTAPTRAAPVRVAFVDAVPDGVGEDNTDSDNFFLREAGDDKRIAVFYTVSGGGAPIERAQLMLFAPEAASPLAVIDDPAAAGQPADGKLTRTLAWRAPIATTPQPFYRLQLRVTLAGAPTVHLTPIADADSGRPGWQCPPDGLAVHDLTWKHRPVLNVHPDDIGRPCSVAEFIVASGGALKEWQAGKLTAQVHAPGVISPSDKSFFDLFNDGKATLGDLSSFSTEQRDVLRTDIGDETVYHAANTTAADGYVFVQYWMFSNFSRRPFNICGLPANPNVQHEGDLECCFVTVRLCDPDAPGDKSRWLQPIAATALQHFYAQTLKWDPASGAAAPNAHSQEHIEHQEDRPVVYIALGSHATYFAADNDIEVPDFGGYLGTQAMYDPTPESALDRTARNPVDYRLRSVTGWIREVRGRWGFLVRNLDDFVANGPTGPPYRLALLNARRGVNVYDHPLRVHNESLKKSQRRELTIAVRGDMDAALQEIGIALVQTAFDALKPTAADWLARGVGAPDVDQAVQCFSKAIELEPGNADAHALRAMARREEGDLTGATRDYARALELAPNHTDALIGRSKVARLTREPRAAERDLTKAAALRAAGEDYRSERLERAVSRDFRDGRRYLERALHHYYNRNDPARALRDLEVYLQLTDGLPDDAAVTMKLAALTTLGRLGPALEFISGLIDKHPGLANLHAARAALYARSGDDKRARVDLDRHADLLLRNKRNCIRALDAMAAAQPEATAILIERGRLYEDIGDIRTAHADAREALRLAPQNVNLRAWAEALSLQLGEKQ
jgi:tetratricopeptide (TPR) repeat protein